MKIIPYNPKYRDTFIELNLAWINDMFEVEPADIEEFDNIEKSIDAGGQIFYALDDSDNVMACCMIAPNKFGDYEIMKLAADPKYAKQGAGTACLNACIEYAKEKHLDKVIMVSNTKCVQAIRIYQKYGFIEVPVDKAKFPFERANIAFEYYLSQ